MNPLPVIRDAWFFFSRNLATIAVLCLPLIMLESLAQYVLASNSGPDTSPAYSVVVGLLFYPLYTGSLIIFLAARSNGEQPRLANVWALALSLWPRFAVLAALSTLLIMVGISLMLLPGLYVLVKLAFSEYLLVLRGLSPLAAMRDSFIQTHGHFARVLLCLLCVMVPLWALDLLSYHLAGKDNDVLLFALDCGNGFLQLFASVVTFRLFMLISSETARG
jgi:hypothetical protein